MAAVSRKVLITGAVQGVSFRASMREQALRVGVRGWVKNRDDGAVEALVQGDEGEVEKLIDWARVGPPGARVLSVELEILEDYPTQEGFRIVVPDWWEDEGDE